MKVKEALRMLKTARKHFEGTGQLGWPSAINPQFTIGYTVDLMIRVCEKRELESTLEEIFVLRVHQACRNEARPVY